MRENRSKDRPLQKKEENRSLALLGMTAGE
jgi:hypothetical protein